MMFLKGCPKCSGDMHLNKDLYGQYVTCFQCGYMKNVTDGYKKPLVRDLDRQEDLEAA